MKQAVRVGGGFRAPDGGVGPTVREKPQRLADARVEGRATRRAGGVSPPRGWRRCWRFTRGANAPRSRCCDGRSATGEDLLGEAERVGVGLVAPHGRVRAAVGEQSQLVADARVQFGVVPGTAAIVGGLPELGEVVLLVGLPATGTAAVPGLIVAVVLAAPGAFGAGDLAAVPHPGALQLHDLDTGGQRAGRVGVVHVPAQGADGIQNGVGVLPGMGGGVGVHGGPPRVDVYKISLTRV